MKLKNKVEWFKDYKWSSNLEEAYCWSCQKSSIGDHLIVVCRKEIEGYREHSCKVAGKNPPKPLILERAYIHEIGSCGF